MLSLFRHVQILLQRRNSICGVPRLANSQHNIKSLTTAQNLLLWQHRTTISSIHTTISQRSTHNLYNRSLITSKTPFVYHSASTQFPKRTFFNSKHVKAEEQPQGTIHQLIQPIHSSELSHHSHIPPSDPTPSKSTTNESLFKKLFAGTSYEHSTAVTLLHLVAIVVIVMGGYGLENSRRQIVDGSDARVKKLEEAFRKQIASLRNERNRLKSRRIPMEMLHPAAIKAGLLDFISEGLAAQSVQTEDSKKDFKALIKDHQQNLNLLMTLLLTQAFLAHASESTALKFGTQSNIKFLIKAANDKNVYSIHALQCLRYLSEHGLLARSILWANSDVVYWLAKMLEADLPKLPQVSPKFRQTNPWDKQKTLVAHIMANIATAKQAEEEWTEQVSRDAQFIAQKLYNVAANSIQKCYDQHGMCPSVAINAPAEFYAYIALQKFKREGDKCEIDSELAKEIAKCAERPIVMSAWESKGMKASLQAFVYGIVWGGTISSWKVHRGKMNLNQVGRTTLQNGMGAMVMTGVFMATSKFFRGDSRAESNILVHTANLASLLLMRMMCPFIVVPVLASYGRETFKGFPFWDYPRL